MTTTPPPDAPTGQAGQAGQAGQPGPATPPPVDSGPRVDRDQLRDVARLRRPLDRKVAGVAAGLARHLDVDPLLLRVAFVVLAFFGGSGLVLYGALWLLLPEDGKAQAPLHLDEKSRGIAVVGVGVLAALLLLGDSWGFYWFPWPLALIALAVWFLFFRDKGPQQAPTGTPGAPAGPTYAGSQHEPQHPQQYAQPYAQPYAQQYAQQYSQPPYTQQYAAPRPARPRDPRKRGPLLFGFTMALIALAVGVLGIIDISGADVVGSAYPALALAITGAMLVVGAFFGRAGGLILVGLLASAVTVGSLATEQFDREMRQETPRFASSVDDDYWMPAGELVLDLRDVSDVEALDGRHIDVGGGVGRLEVIVPEGVDVRVSADVDGPGGIVLFDRETGGIDVAADGFLDGGPGDVPVLEIDAQLGIGEITVWTQGGRR